MKIRVPSSFALFAVCLAASGGSANAQLNPEWIASQPLGNSLSAGLGGFVVDAAGNSYLTGTSEPSSYSDVTTVSFAPDGTLRWRHDYNGPENWHDQGHDIALGPGGVVWVSGNTPDPMKYANVLLLKYDAATGTLLDTVSWTTGFGTSESGRCLAVDAAGNVYVGGGTVGDGSDALIVSFDADGNFRWRQQWDGAAWGPYSQDSAVELILDPQGNLDVLLSGYAADLQPDYYVNEYDAATGALLFEASWGTRGGEYVTDMELDAAGDVYVTGTGIDLTDKYATVKFDGATGTLLWQVYDSAEIDDSARALALDGRGGVYVTGTVDPDGDRSNFNDDIYTVKRDAQTSALLWTHRYGDTCKGCYDVPSDLIVDSEGNLFLAGSTSSPPYSSDVITFVLDADTGVETQRGVIQSGAATGILRLDAAENLYNGSSSFNATTGDVTLTLFKYPSLTTSQAPYNLALENFVAGEQATFTVSGATPDRMQYIAYSLTGTGSYWVEGLGIGLGLANPRLLLSARASTSGELVATFPVPAGAGGVPVWFQSAERGAVSPVLSETVQ